MNRASSYFHSGPSSSINLSSSRSMKKEAPGSPAGPSPSPMGSWLDGTAMSSYLAPASHRVLCVRRRQGGVKVENHLSAPRRVDEQGSQALGPVTLPQSR